MKYSYMVKFNGVYYKPGEDVPEDVKEVEKPKNTSELSEETKPTAKKSAKGKK